MASQPSVANAQSRDDLMLPKTDPDGHGLPDHSTQEHEQQEAPNNEVRMLEVDTQSLESDLDTLARFLLAQDLDEVHDELILCQALQEKVGDLAS